MSLNALKKVSGRCVVLFTIITLFSFSVAFGQAVSQISGTARDQSGASIPGAEVTATQTDTGFVRKATSDENGLFVLPDLPTGPYTIQASKGGFQTYVERGIQLQVDSSPSILITLGVGEVTQKLEVEANAVQVETEKLGVGTVMENQRILDLPLNGRNATDLIALTPGAVQTGTSPTWSMNTGVTISVAGGLSNGVYYGLDGAPHVNMYDSTNMPLPFPDALQEFKVETSAQDSQAGMHSGAQVNAVTKSGTNSFHGDAFEFFRNGDLNARNFFSATQDTLKRNQFGGVIGGPIRKNKLFFFGGYQATELRQAPSPTAEFVPTPAMLTGDFSVFTSPACNNGVQVNLKGPFQTLNGKPNQLPLSQISPVALAMAAKLPPALNGCGQVYESALLSQYFWQVPVRADYQLSDRQSIFARYLVTKQNQANPLTLTPNNVLTAGNVALNDMAQDFTVGHTWLISPTMINSFRFSLNRFGDTHQGATFFGPADVGINAYSYVPHEMQFQVTGGFTVGAGRNSNSFNHVTSGSVNDDFSLIRGSHQLAFGADMVRTVVRYQANAFAIGQYSVSNTVTGTGLGDFLAGDLSSLLDGLPNVLNVGQWFPGAYAQDTWKATRRLTITYGLRWEPYLPVSERNGAVYDFSAANFYAGVVSKVWTNAPPGFTYPGDPGFNGKSGINSDWKHFQPRVGIAFDPFGDGKTSIRAGGGISYDFYNLQLNQTADSASPFGGEITVNGPVSLANPWSTTPGGNPFPGYTSAPPIGVFPVGSTYLPDQANLQAPEVYQWNVAIQRQITSGWFASISYLGNHGIHLTDEVQSNPAIYIPGNCTAGQYGLTAAGPCSTTGNVNNRRVLNLANPVAAAAISSVSGFDSGATSGYNGLSGTTQYRKNNLSLISNYTWSHCIGLTTIGTASANLNQYLPHQNDRNLDVGNCSQDRRVIANVTVVAQTPKFSHRAVNLIASGWQASVLYHFTSGTPVTMATGTTSLFGNGSERPNQVLTNTAASNQGQACANVAPCVSWLNAAAFSQPVAGTLGNMGVYNILGPSFTQIDAAIVRQFSIREGQRLEARFEAFNFLNIVNLGSPTTTLATTSTFGQIRSASDPRILQIAMKYVF